jgi:hypothetical protein
MNFKDYINGDVESLNESTASDIFRFVTNAMVGIQTMSSQPQKLVNTLYEKMPDLVKQTLGDAEALKASTAGINLAFGIDEKKNMKTQQVIYGKALLKILTKRKVDFKALGKDGQEEEASKALIVLLKP